jgi:hypothetical protein
MNTKIKIAVLDKEDVTRTILFWREKSPEERLSAVEFLREQCYIIQGYIDIPRIIRELKIMERSK